MSYAPMTEDDASICLRMSPGVRATYALAEAGDWWVAKVEARRTSKAETCASYRAGHGLADSTRTALAMWALARTNARRAAAELVEAEEAVQ